MKHHVLAIVAALAISPSALAQDSVTRFQVAGVPGNLQACQQADTTLSRPIAVAVEGAVVTIKGAGGIDDKMKPGSQPGTYTSTLALGPTHIEFTAELNVTPKKLSAVSRSLGCHWIGTPIP